MNNFELEEFLRASDCGGGQIKVLACDQLPVGKPLEPGSTIIANLSPISSPGTHWCLFHAPNLKSPDYKEGLLIWFDSLGVTDRLFYPQFEKFFENYSVILSNNGSSVQEFRRYSESCGMYALCVADQLCANTPFQEVMDSFDTGDLNLNECVVLLYLSERFNTGHFDQYEGCI
jgi:hypothetical protein